jgi:hypothetical protein
MAIGVTSLLLAISQGQHEGWDSAYMRELFATAAVFFAAFLLIDLRGKQPFVDLKL